MKKLTMIVTVLLLLLGFSAHSETITLTDQNTMYLNSQVDAGSMGELIIKLQELNKVDTNDPIYLVLNTPGGSIYDGFDFIRYAKTSRRPVNTVTIFAASMGFQLVEALGKRYMTEFSTLMSHRAKGDIGPLEMPGNHDTRYAHFMSHIKEQDEQVVKRTKGKFTLESYAKIIQDEYWANSSKAISDGFADEEASLLCDKSLEKTTSKIVNLGFFSVKVELSNCPLITAPLSVEPVTGLKYIEDNNIDVKKEFEKKFDLKNLNL